MAVLLIAAVVVFALGGGTSTSQLASTGADDIATNAALVVGHWGSYHAHVKLISGRGGGDVKYSSSTSVSVDSTKADKHVRLVTTGNGTFISANAAFYIDNPVLAQHAADRWLEVKDATGFLAPSASAPSVGAGCMLSTHGTLRKGGTTTVGGRGAIEIDDAGDMPGTTPGKLFVATDGTADLLRVEETGVTNGTAPVSLNLSAAAQQFLVLLYDSNIRSAQIEKECGCPTPTFEQFHKAMVDVVASDIAYQQGVNALPLDAGQRSVADGVVAAFRPLIANEMVQANAASFAQASPLWSVHEQLSQTAGDAASALHTALGVPPNPCSFDAPA